MTAIATAFVRLRPDSSGLAAETRTSTGKVFGGLKGHFRDIGKSSGEAIGRGATTSVTSAFRRAAVAGAAAFAAVRTVDLLKGTIGAASDLNETVSKSQVLFGSAAVDVQAFAGKAAAAFGQSKQQALDAASTFATFGKAAGLQGDKLATFSTKLTGLASDMASFSNTSPQEAIEAIGAALRGEAEPIRRYGVLLDDATLRQQALKLGLIKTTKDALTPAQKVLAAQAAIYKQTTAAQGDFARTSGGLANQQRILAARLENIKASIGTKLLPVVVRLAKFANDQLIPAFGKIAHAVAPAFRAISLGLGAFVSAVRDGDVTSDGFVGKMETVGDFIHRRVIPAIGQLVTWFRTRLVPAFRETAAYVQTNVLPVVRSLVQFFVTKVVPAIRTVVTGALAGLRSAFRSIASAIQRNRPQLEALGRAMLKVAGFIYRTLAPVLGTTLKVAFQTAGKIIGTTIDVISALVRIAQKIPGIIREVKAIPGKVLDAFQNAPTLLLEAGKNIVLGLIRGIIDKAGDLIQAIKEHITDKLPSFVKKALGISSPSKVFRAIGGHVMDGLIQGLRAKEGALSAQLGRVTDRLTSIREAAASLASSVRDTITGGAELTNTPDQTVAGITTFLRGQLAADRAFQSGLASLSKLGLGKGLISQLAQAGPESAGNIVANLSHASRGDLAQVTALQSRINATAKATGQFAAQEVYSPQLEALRKQQRELIAAVHQVGRDVAAALDHTAHQAKTRARTATKARP